uniref:Uncharacterized protein n=1 Tax=Zea mays TaxID=4577 RepID=C4IYC9_MAIZE|nr:unknown [Zea mays]
MDGFHLQGYPMWIKSSLKELPQKLASRMRKAWRCRIQYVQLIQTGGFQRGVCTYPDLTSLMSQ